MAGGHDPPAASAERSRPSPLRRKERKGGDGLIAHKLEETPPTRIPNARRKKEKKERTARSNTSGEER